MNHYKTNKSVQLTIHQMLAPYLWCVADYFFFTLLTLW